jgi:hypothetical protein
MKEVHSSNCTMISFILEKFGENIKITYKKRVFKNEGLQFWIHSRIKGVIQAVLDLCFTPTFVF